TATPDPRLEAVTERIRARSARTRAAYLALVEARREAPARTRMSCGNLAHAYAACGAEDKSALRGARAPNLGIVTAYNDMLSAHQPFATYPEQIRRAARRVGATAQ